MSECTWSLFFRTLTIGTAQQVRVADRVITLTDSGDIRKRDSLLVLQKRASVGRKSEFGEEIENAFFGGRPLSAYEVVESIVMYKIPGVMTSPDGSNAKTINPAVYRYFVGFGGRGRFLLFLGLCAVFVFAMTFSR